MTTKYRYTTSTNVTDPNPADLPSEAVRRWNTLVVSVIRSNEDGSGSEKVGEYTRNYPQMYHTFCPFRQGGDDFALVSDKYVRTAVMALPDCKIIAAEEPGATGFCPTGFYVPVVADSLLGRDWGSGPIVGPNGQFGFVTGCCWGDDNSWKIQFLDLTRIKEGIIRRDDRFGYVEVISDLSQLEEQITVEPYSENELAGGNVHITVKGRHWHILGPIAKIIDV